MAPHDLHVAPIMSDPVLYGLSRSVYTRIARLALEEKGVRYALEEVEIFGRRRARRASRTPAVRPHSGFRARRFLLYETGAITRYVDEAFAGRGCSRRSRCAARMNQAIGIVDSYATGR